MTPHPLVSQLRFTRREFMRAIKGVSDHDARQRLLPMNCISWNIGHLAQYVGNIDHQAPYRREMPAIAELTNREAAI
jgi:hypothetical protein